MEQERARRRRNTAAEDGIVVRKVPISERMILKVFEDKKLLVEIMERRDSLPILRTAPEGIHP